MGMGHVPQDPIRPQGEGSQFQGRQRRGASLRRNPGSAQPLAALRLGRANWAEERVAQWYRTHGFEVIARNWVTRGGELDVVARRDKLVVVCEVKARADARYGTPAEAMTPVKQRRVRLAGFRFARELGEPGLHLRFDLACITGVHLEVFEDAF